MISVCFITKNEEAWIGECIEHLRPLAEEFIVLDTGSTDRTIAIARAHGAQVHEAPWPNDFSAARNQSLQYATMPWILKIDPDERLAPRDFEKIRDLTKGSAPGYQCWTRAYTNDASRFTLQSFSLCQGEYPEYEKDYYGYVSYPNMRLFKRLPQVHYVGKIHESVEPTLPGWANGKSPVPPPLEIPFHHYGHTDAAHLEKGKDSLYNGLLLEEVQANPQNWYALYEIANHLFQSGKLTEAIPFYEKANHALPGKPQIVCNWGYAFICLGKFEEGEKLLKECLKIDPQYSDAYLNLGVSALEQNQLDSALEYFKRTLSLAPHSFVALRAQGQALAKLHRWGEAESSFLKALSIFPRFVEARVDLAILAWHSGRSDKARSLIKECLALEPRHPRALELMNHL